MTKQKKGKKIFLAILIVIVVLGSMFAFLVVRNATMKQFINAFENEGYEVAYSNTYSLTVLKEQGSSYVAVAEIIIFESKDELLDYQGENTYLTDFAFEYKETCYLYYADSSVEEEIILKVIRGVLPYYFDWKI